MYDARACAAADQIGVEHGVCLSLAIDIDMSSSFPGLYFGVRRSPVKTAEQAVLLARRIAASSGSLRLRGAMGYEGQIAGLPDRSAERRVGKECVRTCRSRGSQ